MGGIQLAKELRKLNIQQKFYIVLVTAEEYEDKENIFDYIYYKPLPGSTIKMLFNEIMLGESKFWGLKLIKIEICKNLFIITIYKKYNKETLL